ncbi:MAG: hypothetical protein F6K22_21235 [Okeania sp. SIO2F4]|nr:hypothetical protein [Okeania sp. SIO2F4]
MFTTPVQSENVDKFLRNGITYLLLIPLRKKRMLQNSIYTQQEAGNRQQTTEICRKHLSNSYKQL